MASSSSKVLALGALIFSLLVTYGSCARPANFTASDFTADPNWEAARATWYGAPTGAGPDDDGMCRRRRCRVSLVFGIRSAPLHVRVALLA